MHCILAGWACWPKASCSAASGSRHRRWTAEGGHSVRLLSPHSLQEELKLDVEALRSSPVSEGVVHEGGLGSNGQLATWGLRMLDLEAFRCFPCRRVEGALSAGAVLPTGMDARYHVLSWTREHWVWIGLYSLPGSAACVPTSFLPPLLSHIVSSHRHATLRPPRLAAGSDASGDGPPPRQLQHGAACSSSSASQTRGCAARSSPGRNSGDLHMRSSSRVPRQHRRQRIGCWTCVQCAAVISIGVA